MQIFDFQADSECCDGSLFIKGFKDQKHESIGNMTFIVDFDRPPGPATVPENRLCLRRPSSTFMHEVASQLMNKCSPIVRRDYYTRILVCVPEYWDRRFWPYQTIGTDGQRTSISSGTIRSADQAAARGTRLELHISLRPQRARQKHDCRRGERAHGT
jgi:hypothetical protein